ncbi:MAG: hypothetical protein M1530_02970 [Candidatus Marsarchaeota archaeon]|nr:hypothetical protein [Candidatus Marsarchaeota archaeon]
MKHETKGAGEFLPLRVILPALHSSLPPVLMLLLLLPSIHAADLISGTVQCTSSTLTLATDFNSPIYAIIGLTIALIAIAYMAGSAYAKPEWTVWARSEGITLAWSIVLVGVILGAFASSCTLSNLMLGGQGLGGQPGQSLALTPAMRASQYMGSLLNNYGVTVASQLVRSSIRDQMNALNYAYWSIPVFDGGGLAYSANQRAWATDKDLVADIYIPLMVSIMVQKLLMDIAIPGVFAVILPAAIMLRMLFLTRDVGNLLLALSFAVYFALPLTYVFFFDATAAVQQNIFIGSTPEQPFGSSFALGYDSIIGDAMQRVGFMAPQAILAPNLALVVTVSMTMALHKAFRGMVA